MKLMIRKHIKKPMIKVRKDQLIKILEVIEYQKLKLKHYTNYYGDVELFYGKWRKINEKKNNI